MELLLHYLNSIHELSPGLREHLENILEYKLIRKKQFLLKAGRVAGSICFIEKGLLRCFYIKDDKEVSAWFMKEGDVVISVESFFSQSPGDENIQALEDCSLHYITYAELQDTYHRYPEFNYTARVVTEKYYKFSAQQLYSLRMLHAGERYDWLTKNYPDLIKRVPAKFLASYIGVTDVRLSKIKAGIQLKNAWTN